MPTFVVAADINGNGSQPFKLQLQHGVEASRALDFVSGVRFGFMNDFVFKKLNGRGIASDDGAESFF